MGRSAWIPIGSFALALGLSQLCGTPLRGLHARQAAGGTCDWLTLPLCVRPIKVKPKEGKPTPPGGSTTEFTPETLAGLQGGMNKIWEPCCIAFQLSLGPSVELPRSAFQDGKLPVANSDGQTIRPNEGLQKLFKQNNSKRCLNLYYAADVIAGGLPAGADLKGAALIGENGMIVDDGASPALGAHEAGHNLGLRDNDTPGNLMNGGDTSEPGTTLDPAQCEPARKRAKKYLNQFSR